MGRFRSFVRRTMRRSLKPFVMLGIAGTLSVSLVVTTPSNAQAFVPVLAPPVILLGSGVATLPSVMGALSLTGPIGWGLMGLGALALGAAATQDYWLPYVTGDFGKGESGDGPVGEYPPESSYQKKSGEVDSYFTLGELSISGGQVIIPWDYAKLGAANGSSNFNVHYAYRIACKHPDTRLGDNGVRIKEDVSTIGGGLPPGKGTSGTVGRNCEVNGSNWGEPIGAEVGVAGYENLPLMPDTWTMGGPSTYRTYGSLKAPSKPGFDPNGEDVTYQTTVECIRADGTKFNLTAEASGAQKAIKVPACAAADPTAHATGKTDVVGLAPGLAPQPLYTVPNTPAPAEYPACDHNRGGPLCTLKVMWNGQECMVGQFECAHWTDPNIKNDPRLSCQYGPYAVATAVCNPLERAYEPGGAPATDANIDGNPSTRSNTDPSGQTIPKTSTSTGTVPSTTTRTAPAPGEAAPAPAPGTTGQSAECFPGGWAVFNPMWIVDGISCSFIPKMDITQRVGELQALAGTKAPLSWMAPQMTGPGSSGCPAWVVQVNTTEFGPGYAKNIVCDSTFIQAIVGARGPLFGIVAGAMIWPLFRSLWYAAIPVLRVTPGSSK